MRFDYENVRSLSAEDFASMKSDKDCRIMTMSDAADLKRIEEALDLRSGLLKDEQYYVGIHTCGCGHRFTFYDFVCTSLRQPGHTKSFVAHTLLGSKYVINPSRTVTCSSCEQEQVSLDYITPKYCCCRDDDIERVEDGILPDVDMVAG